MEHIGGNCGKTKIGILRLCVSLVNIIPSVAGFVWRDIFHIVCIPCFVLRFLKVAVITAHFRRCDSICPENRTEFISFFVSIFGSTSGFGFLLCCYGKSGKKRVSEQESAKHTGKKRKIVLSFHRVFLSYIILSIHFSI